MTTVHPSPPQAEVATDYNAGFTSAIAALKHLSITKQLPSITR